MLATLLFAGESELVLTTTSRGDGKLLLLDGCDRMRLELSSDRRKASKESRPRAFRARALLSSQLSLSHPQSPLGLEIDNGVPHALERVECDQC